LAEERFVLSTAVENSNATFASARAALRSRRIALTSPARSPVASPEVHYSDFNFSPRSWRHLLHGRRRLFVRTRRQLFHVIAPDLAL